MKSQDKKASVYVAMSGGVDSSVAAALLKKQGFEVIGVFMKPWSPYGTNSKLETLNSKQAQNSNFCLWQKDREDAMRVASKLGIPLLTWDFSKEYKKRVVDYMIHEYRKGRTPNPDVMCNKHIKFGLFLDRALREGADFIATGHYVRRVASKENRVARKNKNKKYSLLNTHYSILIAKDKNKDQSYFLWTLTQKQLKHCLFPIGDYIKPEVRKIAKKFGLPTADKKDSQGVCFIGPLDMKDFLKTKIKPKPGKIIDLAGKFLGNHDGVYYYTIGQRHGLNLGIKNKELGIKGRHETPAHYVTDKDVVTNTLIVASGKENSVFCTKEIKLTSINFIDPAISSSHVTIPVLARVRYRQPLTKARIEIKSIIRNSKFLILKFDKPVKFVASGQSAVFYRGNEMLGGGIIR